MASKQHERTTRDKENASLCESFLFVLGALFCGITKQMKKQARKIVSGGDTLGSEDMHCIFVSHKAFSGLQRNILADAAH